MPHAALVVRAAVHDDQIALLLGGRGRCSHRHLLLAIALDLLLLVLLLLLLVRPLHAAGAERFYIILRCGSPRHLLLRTMGIGPSSAQETPPPAPKAVQEPKLLYHVRWRALRHPAIVLPCARSCLDQLS